MKKIVSLLIVLALLCCGAMAEPIAQNPEADAAIVPGNRLGFELLSDLYAAGENRVLSPLSLRLALAMAASGAKGETLNQLFAALDVQDPDSLVALIPEGIQHANAIFAAPELEILPEFTQQMNDAFSAEWFQLDENVVDRVNAWVEEKTDGMIQNLMQDAPDADAGMMLINAVAMDADWVDAFKPEATQEETFHAPQGDVQLQMMHQTATFHYAEKDGMQLVCLPYQNGNLAMWVLLPAADMDLAAALDLLAQEGMAYLQSDLEPARVQLALPKLDVTDKNSLADALIALGVQDAFADVADFSGISTTPLFIEEVMQQAHIQIDEAGTQAAAATNALMMAMSMPIQEEPVEMNVNRPFAFVIADIETGSVCFAGAIENPAA